MNLKKKIFYMMCFRKKNNLDIKALYGNVQDNYIITAVRF